MNFNTLFKLAVIQLTISGTDCCDLGHFVLLLATRAVFLCLNALIDSRTPVRIRVHNDHTTDTHRICSLSSRGFFLIQVIDNDVLGPSESLANFALGASRKFDLIW